MTSAIRLDVLGVSPYCPDHRDFANWQDPRSTWRDSEPVSVELTCGEVRRESVRIGQDARSCWGVEPSLGNRTSNHGAGRSLRIALKEETTCRLKTVEPPRGGRRGAEAP